ncbi:MAG: murein biosynthesis integral membrane protein MurJ [Magnetococcales bacterium]|nr:murein biosynthesis integral membrane protein MurJ [Magnetococcales bacterium]
MTIPDESAVEPVKPSEGGGLIRAVGIISFYTLLSRLLGFARDIAIAYGMGASAGADAFFVALKLPNFLRRLFAEGAFNTAFVPVFAEYLAKGEVEETRRVAQSVFTVLGLVLVLVVVVAQIAMPMLILVAAPGFSGDPAKFQLTVDLTRITFPYIFFISLVALAGGILNSHHRFAVPAATPILLNVCIIAAAMVLSPRMERPAEGLAWGVFLGGVTQLMLQFPALRRIGVPFRLRWDPRHPAIRRILGLMGPSILGVSVAQISLLLDVFIASWLNEGSISYLYYADRLVEFPLGLIGIALGTAILPALSAKAARGDMDGLRSDLDLALRLTVVVDLPAMVGLIVLGEPILALLFQRGAFGPEATHLTAQALLAYSVGLLGFSIVKVVTPAFYSMKDTRTPVKVAIVCLASNMVINLALMVPLQHVGLALATSLTAALNAVLLLRHLKKRLDFHLSPALLSTTARSALACVAMGAFLGWGVWQFWHPGLTTSGRLMILGPLVMGGIVVYGLAAKLLGLMEMEMLLQVVRRKRGGGEP